MTAQQFDSLSTEVGGKWAKLNSGLKSLLCAVVVQLTSDLPAICSEQMSLKRSAQAAHHMTFACCQTKGHHNLHTWHSVRLSELHLTGNVGKTDCAHTNWLTSQPFAADVWVCTSSPTMEHSCYLWRRYMLALWCQWGLSLGHRSAKRIQTWAFRLSRQCETPKLWKTNTQYIATGW